MGLGKTVQTLAALASMDSFPALIVVPPHLVSNWAAEVARFLRLNGQAPRVHILKGLKPYPLPAADIYLVHYLLLRGWLLLALAGACPWLSTMIAPAFPSDPAGATAIFIANAILLGLVFTELVIEVIHIVRFRMTA